MNARRQPSFPEGRYHLARSLAQHKSCGKLGSGICCLGQSPAPKAEIPPKTDPAFPCSTCLLTDANGSRSARCCIAPSPFGSLQPEERPPPTALVLRVRYRCLWHGRCVNTGPDRDPLERGPAELDQGYPQPV